MTARASVAECVVWWSEPSGGRWLQVRIADGRGFTDYASAADHVGPSSWAVDDVVYLAEVDAYRWLAAAGLNEGDAGARFAKRAPDGFRSVRDGLAAAAAEGDLDAQNRLYGAQEAARVAPEREGRRRHRSSRSSAEGSRKQANRALAAELRALGIVPNGEAWAYAKRLQADGGSVSRVSMARFVPELVQP